ncbi:hypothetical protein GCM10011376_06070 [Nocardioides flavus (ex Wang et al. 2016)]|uniref:Uncharacterized protein n=1 Tax=Nocardioides flavus (ex Wang et al. 2016) TaxID=2058780 RepID=A0ABQ3HH55_9ACTN|nr:hypothetical protein [Nocardioides flavus (ex Wang et al. 2016)]GHE15862.1 hypothetical protein GCM10011376_06070 [Nocardioides flavus (ex Wang et al. 2016)]
MDGFDEVEKAAAAREARDAVGARQHRTSKSDEVEAALMRYLAGETYRERAKPADTADTADTADSAEDAGRTNPDEPS